MTMSDSMSKLIVQLAFPFAAVWFPFTVYLAPLKTQHLTFIYIFFGKCDHEHDHDEVQFFCEYSAVIYTSIAVLHWEFHANCKVSRRHWTGKGGYPKCIKDHLMLCANSRVAALLRFAVETNIQSVRWNTMWSIGQGTLVFPGYPGYGRSPVYSVSIYIFYR